MPHILSSHGHELDFDALYARLWEASEDDGAGARVYTSAGPKALKWLIAELAGTPAASGRTLPANSDLRAQVHAALLGGLAERVSERRFRLLVSPGAAATQTGGVRAAARGAAVREEHADVGAGAALVVEAPDDAGSPVEDVDAAAVTAQGGGLVLGGLNWSAWTTLADAAATATTSPGVYAARSDGQLVYIGMAGERRGLGVRGRLRVYARGRGAVSGLGEALLDRALADPAWVADRLARLRTQGGAGVTAWAREAVDRRPLEMAWASCASAAEARTAERSILVELEDVELWNRVRP